MIQPEQHLLMQQGMEAFVASRPSAVFYSPQCKNKHNVYKSRAKDKKEW